MSRIKAALLAFALSIAGLSPAFAQSAPSWITTYGYVATPAQWEAAFLAKQDYLGAPPLLTTGGTMTGRLTTAPSATGGSGFNLAPGVAPTSPNNGDFWTTTVGAYERINGVTLLIMAAPNLAVSPTAPTIASGFCTSPSISANNGTAAFTITIGSACAGSVGVLTMPTAATGWACHFNNLTNPATNTPYQIASTTTTVSVTNYDRTTGVAGNFTAADVINAQCTAY